jgi:hypothetical protein
MLESIILTASISRGCVKEARENAMWCPSLNLLHLNVEHYPSVIGSLGLLDLRVPMADSGYESGSGATAKQMPRP